MPEKTRASAVCGQSTDDLPMVGSLVAGTLVADAFVGVSLVKPSVTGCSKGPSEGRVSVRHSSSGSFVFLGGESARSGI